MTLIPCIQEGHYNEDGSIGWNIGWHSWIKASFRVTFSSVKFFSFLHDINKGKRGEDGTSSVSCLQAVAVVDQIDEDQVPFFKICLSKHKKPAFDTHVPIE